MLLNLIGAIGGAISGRNDAARTQRLAEIAHNDEENRLHTLGHQLLSIPEKNTMTGNLGRLVSDAEAAGFNPLTVLRAGGLSAYNTLEREGHNAANAYQIMAGSGPRPVSHVPSVATAIWGGVNKVMDDITSAVAGGMGQRGMGYSPSASPSFASAVFGSQGGALSNRTMSAGSSMVAGGAALVGSRAASPLKSGDRENTAPTRFLDNDPDSVNVAVGEDAAGDIGGLMFFPIWLSDQIYYNATGKIRGSHRDIMAASAFQLVGQQYKSIFGGMLSMQRQKSTVSLPDRIRQNPNLTFGEPRDGY